MNKCEALVVCMIVNCSVAPRREDSTDIRYKGHAGPRWNISAQLQGIKSTNAISRWTGIHSLWPEPEAY